MARHISYKRFQEFNPDSENISVYLERLEMHFLAMGMEDGRKVLSLLSAVGAKT